MVALLVTITVADCGGDVSPQTVHSEGGEPLAWAPWPQKATLCGVTGSGPHCARPGTLPLCPRDADLTVLGRLTPASPAAPEGGGATTLASVSPEVHNTSPPPCPLHGAFRGNP
jgi:hypothetical protein